MIGSLRGTVQGSIRGQVVVEVGGIGYRVHLTAPTLARITEGEELTVWTHLAVRETAHELFGFTSKEELTWFELLITVSGVGPKSALAIMSAVDSTQLRSAIQRNDPAALSGAYGVGKKTAEKIVLELREKVGALDPRDQAVDVGTDADVVAALIGLGYSAKEARDTVRAIPPGITDTTDRIREAIRLASRT